MDNKAFWAALTLAFGLAQPAMAEDIFDKVEHGYADNNGVKIHYASLGEGPLIVMIHGFPDFWYSWRHQMAALSDEFQCVAVDLRGYNKSDKPEGIENYAMPNLVGDIAAVIKHLGKDKAIVCGHDWGGAIAWQVGINMPDMVEKLIICNLPHPKGFSRELANNPQQQQNSQYARNFQQEGAHEMLTAEGIASFLNAESEEAKQHYIDAFKASDFEAMLAYYKMNYPRKPYREVELDIPNMKMPVLQFHGLDDSALLSEGLNGTWNWMDKDYTLVTVPGAGHWVQHDAADLVSGMIRAWLNR